MLLAQPPEKEGHGPRHSRPWPSVRCTARQPRAASRIADGFRWRDGTLCPGLPPLRDDPRIRPFDLRAVPLIRLGDDRIERRREALRRPMDRAVRFLLISHKPSFPGPACGG